MKCRILLKIDTSYKPYAKDTTEKMKTDLKLCDRDGDGENPWTKKKQQQNNPRRGIEQSSLLAL